MQRESLRNIYKWWLVSLLEIVQKLSILLLGKIHLLDYNEKWKKKRDVN